MLRLLMQPVLYLDLDDTLISWAAGTPAGAAGVREFLLWALDHYEIRWLTRWAPTGEMAPDLLEDLARMSGVHPDRLAGIRGLSWEESRSKVDGIAWLEHVVLGRPFLWLEDDSLPPRAREMLAQLGLAQAWCCCNVTRDAEALRTLHAQLQRNGSAARNAAAAIPGGSERSGSS